MDEGRARLGLRSRLARSRFRSRNRFAFEFQRKHPAFVQERHGLARAETGRALFCVSDVVPYLPLVDRRDYSPSDERDDGYAGQSDQAFNSPIHRFSMAPARPVRGTVEALIRGDLSPAAQREAAAAYARQKLDEVKDHNRRATGREPPHRQVVDGRVGAALDTVNPNGGRIVFLFDVGPNDVLTFVAEQLVLHAPRKSGRFADSFRLYAGGRQIEAGAALPRADEYLVMSPLPYSGKLERGLSDQAPDGLFHAVATLAARLFGDRFSVRFSYRGLGEFGLTPNASGGRGAPGERRARDRTPVIVVRDR